MTIVTEGTCWLVCSPLIRQRGYNHVTVTWLPLSPEWGFHCCHIAGMKSKWQAVLLSKIKAVKIKTELGWFCKKLLITVHACPSLAAHVKSREQEDSDWFRHQNVSDKALCKPFFKSNLPETSLKWELPRYNANKADIQHIRGSILNCQPKNKSWISNGKRENTVVGFPINNQGVPQGTVLHPVYNVLQDLCPYTGIVIGKSLEMAAAECLYCIFK